MKTTCFAAWGQRRQSPRSGFGASALPSCIYHLHIFVSNLPLCTCRCKTDIHIHRKRVIYHQCPSYPTVHLHPFYLKMQLFGRCDVTFPRPPSLVTLRHKCRTPPPGAWRHLWTAPRQGLICNSGRWWNCTAHFSIKKFAKRGGTVWKSVPPANWMRCRNGVSPGINSCTIMAKFSQARYQLFNCA